MNGRRERPERLKGTFAFGKTCNAGKKLNKPKGSLDNGS